MHNNSQPIRTLEIANLKTRTMQKCHSDLNVLNSSYTSFERNSSNFNQILNTSKMNSDTDYRALQNAPKTPERVEDNNVLDLSTPKIVQETSPTSSSSFSLASSPEKSQTSSSYCPTFPPGYNPSNTFGQIEGEMVEIDQINLSGTSLSGDLNNNEQQEEQREIRDNTAPQASQASSISSTIEETPPMFQSLPSSQQITIAEPPRAPQNLEGQREQTAAPARSRLGKFLIDEDRRRNNWKRFLPSNRFRDNEAPRACKAKRSETVR